MFAHFFSPYTHCLSLDSGPVDFPVISALLCLQKPSGSLVEAASSSTHPLCQVPVVQHNRHPVSFLGFWNPKVKENAMYLNTYMYYLPPFLFLGALFVSFGGEREASLLSTHTWKNEIKGNHPWSQGIWALILTHGTLWP